MVDGARLEKFLCLAAKCKVGLIIPCLSLYPTLRRGDRAKLKTRHHYFYTERVKITFRYFRGDRVKLKTRHHYFY